MSENWKHISGGFYVVRTEAGLRHACKHFAGALAHEHEIKGFPNKYPALIALSAIGPSGSESIRVQSLPLDVAMAALRESDAS